MMQLDEDFEQRLEELGAMGRWSEVMRLLGEEAEQTTEVERSIELRSRLARLALDRFSNQAIAVEHLSVVARLCPDHPSREELIDLLRKRRDWSALERLVGTEETERRRSAATAGSHPASGSGLSTGLWLAILLAVVTTIGVLAWLR